MERRSFIKSSSLAAGAFIHPLAFHSKENKIQLAIVGTGWWGTDLLLTDALASGHFEIVGLCDVNSQALDKAANVCIQAVGKKPQLFSDYKAMYELTGLEAVAIATPTHWHALQFIDACNKGLHVFLEKPISYDIREGQAMLAAHRTARNIVCVDFPRLKADTNNQVKDFIESGEAGKILQVQANIHSREGVLEEKEIPDFVDFDTFCGPAPYVKYLCNPNGTLCNWRGIFELSRGIMADWGIHYIHNARQVLGLDLPTQVAAIGGNTKNIMATNPDHLDVKFDFNGLPVCWTHKSWGYTSPNPDHNIGVYYFGEKATIFAGDLGWEVYPTGGTEVIKHGDVRFTPNKPGVMEIYQGMMVGLFNDFAKAVQQDDNGLVSTNFEEAFKTTSSIIYGDMAYRAGSLLQIDTDSMDIKNHQAAHQRLKRAYRAPYKHPYA